MENLKKLILTRKSVRTFDDRRLSDADRDSILAFAKTVDNPFGVPVGFVWLDGDRLGLSSKVLAGEHEFLCALVTPGEHSDEAYGYTLERVVLHAWSLGVGTVWIGGTMDRKAFEAACKKRDGERMPCMTPLGYPAEKRSVRDRMMRKGINADTRRDPAELFFDGDFDRPLDPAAVPEWMSGALELVRWAPSAVNKQPWRVVIDGNTAHFYEKSDRNFTGPSTGDLQRIDVGIGLCHYTLALEAQRIPWRVGTDDPGLILPENVKYIASVTAEV